MTNRHKKRAPCRSGAPVEREHFEKVVKRKPLTGKIISRLGLKVNGLAKMKRPDQLITP